MSDWYGSSYTLNGRLQGFEEGLSAVSASLASARSSQKRLRAELSKVRGSLEQRLDRLSAAFDAFVEISDLRVTIGLFDDQGRVRHQARQLLRGEPTTSLVSDVDGYWLAPAYVALSVVADDVADTESLATARQRDTLRATVFHVLGTSLLGGRSTVSAGMLADALPALGESMPGYQRAVWTLLADGFFGEAGWELARRRGVEFVRGLPDDGPGVAKIRQIGTAAARVEPLPRVFEGISDVGAALEAAARLTALRTWVEEVLAGWTNEPALEVDPGVRRSLDLLIDEGSPEELPLLARERELRAVIEAAGSEAPAWDAPAGETLGLLHADAADAGRPVRRAVAVRVLGAHVLTAAERLADTARCPFPAEVRARTRQGTVTLTARGPESLAAAHRRIASMTRVSSQGRTTSAVLAAVGVGFLVLMVLAGWGWVFLALGALVMSVVVWHKDVRARETAVRDEERARRALADEIDQRMAVLAECRLTLVDRQSAIEDNLDALRAALS